VAIYLPDAYAKEPQRRFPVLYFLHGYTDSTPLHQRAELFGKMLESLVATGRAQPMILVVPNGLNKYYGSFYANSEATGNWDDYVTRDVVAYVDQHYRTQATAEHRAIAGHSMGGYGALTLAFRHPEVFGSVYAMSPCCTDLVADLGPSSPAWSQLGKLRSPEDVTTALKSGGFFLAVFTAMDAALAPDAKAALFGDAPFTVQSNEVRTDPEAYARIAAKMPVNMVVPLTANIARLGGIFIEYGAQDNFAHIPIGAQELASRLSQAGISYTLEVFQGDHGNRFNDRVSEHMLPWVSRQIAR
jgi:S-formylglutathione hydrolase